MSSPSSLAFLFEPWSSSSSTRRHFVYNKKNKQSFGSAESPLPPSLLLHSPKLKSSQPKKKLKTLDSIVVRLSVEPLPSSVRRATAVVCLSSHGRRPSHAGLLSRAILKISNPYSLL
ncbi:uncharacterized protein DS421_20g689100 [Arachis hypogaea]|nr:uncharacterized protein DS421_20g689100 [Arachis hypogaea]